MQYHSYAPDVTLLIVFLLQHLRSDIVRCAKPLTHLLLTREESRKTEVYHFYVETIFTVKHQILGF